MMKKLFRSQTDRKLGGICGGLGEMLDTDPNLIRLAAVLLALMTVVIPFLIVYIIGIAIIPEGSGKNDHVRDPQA